MKNESNISFGTERTVKSIESMEDFSKYSQSPAHLAVARRDYAALRRIISTLPRLSKASEVSTKPNLLRLSSELMLSQLSLIAEMFLVVRLLFI
ncbi:hypothetical protein GBA52_018448 [Prunus armeniaca]|nr:hypothetical protein GBA52_018448 [Prunus armeniaca]